MSVVSTICDKNSIVYDTMDYCTYTGIPMRALNEEFKCMNLLATIYGDWCSFTNNLHVSKMNPVRVANVYNQIVYPKVFFELIHFVHNYHPHNHCFTMLLVINLC